MKPINSPSYRPSLQPSVPVYLDHMLQRYNRRGGIKWQVLQLTGAGAALGSL